MADMWRSDMGYGCDFPTGMNRRWGLLHIIVMGSDVGGMHAVMHNGDLLRDAELPGLNGERGEGFIAKAMPPPWGVQTAMKRAIKKYKKK